MLTPETGGEMGMLEEETPVMRLIGLSERESAAATAARTRRRRATRDLRPSEASHRPADDANARRPSSSQPGGCFEEAIFGFLSWNVSGKRARAICRAGFCCFVLCVARVACFAFVDAPIGVCFETSG